MDAISPIFFVHFQKAVHELQMRLSMEQLYHIRCNKQKESVELRKKSHVKIRFVVETNTNTPKILVNTINSL